MNVFLKLKGEPWRNDKLLSCDWKVTGSSLRKQPLA